MCVHGDNGFVSAEEKNYVCCFRANSSKLLEGVSCFFNTERKDRFEVSVIFFEGCFCGLFYCFCFVLLETGWFDLLFDLVCCGLR